MRSLDIPNTEIASAQLTGLTAKFRELLAVAKEVEQTLSNVDSLLATIGQRPRVSASIGKTDGKKRDGGNRRKV